MTITNILKNSIPVMLNKHCLSMPSTFLRFQSQHTNTNKDQLSNLTEHSNNKTNNSVESDNNPSDLPGLLFSHNHRDIKTRVESLPSQIFLPGPEEYQTIPLIRGIITDQFNLDLMVFGELETKSITDELIDFSREVERGCYAETTYNVNSKALATIQHDSLVPASPEQYFENARKLNMFGLTIPLEYGGLQLGPIAIASSLEAAGSEDICLGTCLAIHNLFVCRGLVNFGSDAQRSLYLPKLASGKLLGLICRPDNYNKSCFTDTTSSNNPNESINNGTKSNSLLNLRKTKPLYLRSDVKQSSLPCGNYCGDFWSPSEFIFKNEHESILMCTGSWSLYSRNKLAQNSSKYSFESMSYQCYSDTFISPSIPPFIVDDTDFKKHCITKNQPTCGMGGLKKQSLFMDYKFDVESISKEKQLECFNSDMCDMVLAEEAYLLLAILVGRLKRLISQISNNCMEREIFNRKLGNFSAVQACMFEAQARVYAMQSTVYFLAGIAEKESVSVRFESQLALCYLPQLAYNCIDQLSSISGADSRFRAEFDNLSFTCLEQLKLDISTFQFLLGDQSLLINSLEMQIIQMLEADAPTKDISFISASTKRRNYFASSREKRLKQMQNLADGYSAKEIDAVRLNLIPVYRLFEHIHPTLRRAAFLTEKAALFLSTCSRFVEGASYDILVKAKESESGKDEMQRHQWISYEPLLKSAFNVLIMCSVISRASRSRCIGLRNCDEETMMANLICEALSVEVDTMLNPCLKCQDIVIMPETVFNLNDEFLYPQHPLDPS